MKILFSYTIAPHSQTYSHKQAYLLAIQTVHEFLHLKQLIKMITCSKYCNFPKDQDTAKNSLHKLKLKPAASMEVNPCFFIAMHALSQETRKECGWFPSLPVTISNF
mgnify:CR=1 FL=1